MTALRRFLFAPMIITLSQAALGVWIPCPQDGEFGWNVREKTKDISVYVGTFKGYKDLSPPVPKYPWEPITEVLLHGNEKQQPIEQKEATTTNQGLICHYTAPDINPEFPPAAFLSYLDIEYKNKNCNPGSDPKNGRLGFECTTEK
jgi:hypothetical protein